MFRTHCRVNFTRIFAALLTLGASLQLAGCDDAATTPTPVATSIQSAVSTTPLTGTVNQQLTEPLSARVLDQNGFALPGVLVTWTVITGGGKLDSATSLTDASGIARVNWTLGTTAGSQAVEASTNPGLVVRFEVNASPSSPAQLEMNSGNAQVVAVGGLSAPLTVRVLDAFGNPVSGVSITWGTTGGMLSATSTVTGDDGMASVTLSVGNEPQTYTVTATMPDGSTIVFGITGA